MKILRQIFPSRLPILAAGSVALLCFPLLSQAAFFQTNLVSDIPGLAAHTDPNLVNPWGISSSPTSPFWISDNGTGVSTLYNGQGQPFPVASPLVVTVPPAGSAPTGQVFNNTSSSFNLAPPGQPVQLARFIFTTEDGTISAWNSGTSAILKVDNSTSGAVYKGLAIGSDAITGDGHLYAANFNAGTIDVFDKDFKPVTLSGNFTDINIPSGYAPFNVQNLGGKLYVTYALRGPTGDDVAGPGHGFVDVFDLNGNLLQRLVSQGALNSPWGLALAPAGFGEFGNDLLVGNFGDGVINAFDVMTGNLLGQIRDAMGDSIAIEGLWGLQVGNGGNGGDRNKLYFTAGIPGPDEVEDHGLFGSLQFVPEPGSLALMSGVLAVWLPWRRNSRTKPTRRQVA